jgi:transcriptional regulator with XRE-family HTH domain
MTDIDDDPVRRNRARQTEWYGESLNDRFRRLLNRLQLSQAGLADVLGLSAPMLSQLMSGHRAKISNPAVLARLLAVEEIAADQQAASWTDRDLHDRLTQVRAQAPTTSSAFRITPAGGGEPQPAKALDPVAGMQALLRSVASAAEIEGAAQLIERTYPDLATLLRIYGNGRTADARAHYASVTDG